MARKQVLYNGFTFPFSKCEVSETTQMSDDGLSPLGTLYRFTISGILSAANVAAFQTQLYTMRTKLTQPRRGMAVQWSEDGSTWVDYWNFATGGDDGWGPIPGELWIRDFRGGLACLYSWSVQVFKKQCWDGSCQPASAQSNILSITRDWSHSVDEAGYTTRTVSGILRKKRTDDYPPDWYRSYCLPDIPPWFKRTAQTFSQSSNGLELHYSVTDVEQYWTLPKPVIKGHAVYSCHLTPYDGLTATHTLSGEFNGAASTTKYQLFEAVNDLLMAKFPDWSGAQPGAQLMFTDITMSENVYENSLSFNITGKVPAGGWNDLNMALLRFYQAPPGSDGATQAPNPFGNSGASGESSGIMAPIPAAWDACGTATGPSDEAGIPPVVTSPTTSEPPKTEDTPDSPGDNTSKDHQERPYLEYREVLAFEVDSKIAMFVPKSDTSSDKPFFQRTATPTLTIYQSGYWIRAAKDNFAFQSPKPYGWNQKDSNGLPLFVVANASQKPQAVEAMGASGWFTCTYHWAYTIRANYHLDDYLNGVVYFPADPRHSDSIQPVMTASGNGSMKPSFDPAQNFRPVERLDRSTI